MNTQGLLDQLLKSASGALSGNSSTNTRQGSQGAGGASQLGSLLSGAGGGALAAGAVGLLLGNKKARKMGGKAAKYGGMAALGVVAFKAWQQWQQNNANAPQGQPQTVDRLPASQQEPHSHAILRALIGAAKADGHIDDRERELIDAEVAKLTNDPQTLQWFDAELRKPLDPAEVARAAQTPEMAAEMYLASLLVVDEQSFMEKAYLQELSSQLKLDPQLMAELDKQVQQA
ncbi:tellurite resistance TerB family protein [Halopseudomonas maritima]|uniref:tellurite resistance TerB family protein n=1 Tax=Halopseudomonas maritima TaxID=2918528 RepID=UPI001EEB8B84|nr:tellurite resistance TerB family protein [Halopseudomonas maritima]UJJ32968.1 tellurite resistance TerB family protein [Halopseudomonas maritima]